MFTPKALTVEAGDARTSPETCRHIPMISPLAASLARVKVINCSLALERSRLNTLALRRGLEAPLAECLLGQSRRGVKACLDYSDGPCAAECA